MFFSLAKLAKPRPDRRPLYRRIFTNRRLDRLHRYTVRTIIGFILFSTSFCIVNGALYYVYVRPVKQEEQQLLERELIEADLAGFDVRSKH